MLSFHLDVASLHQVCLRAWQLHVDMDDVDSAKSCKRGNAAAVYCSLDAEVHAYWCYGVSGRQGGIVGRRETCSHRAMKDQQSQVIPDKLPGEAPAAH